MSEHQCTGDTSCKPCYVSHRRARMVRVELDAEHEDAVRAGEAPIGSHRSIDLGGFLPRPPRPAQRRVEQPTADGLW